MNSSSTALYMSSIAYVALTNIKQFIDVFLLYFISIYLLNFQHGGMMSSFYIIIKSIAVILFNPVSAKILDKKSLSHRFSLSIIISITQSIIIFLCIFLEPSNTFYFLAFLITIGVLTIVSGIDNQIHFPVLFLLDNKNILPVARTKAIANISFRAFHALGPGVALFLKDYSWQDIFLFLFLFSVILISIPVLSLIVFGELEEPSPLVRTITSSKNETKEATTPEEVTHSIIKWNKWAQFLINLALSGVGLTLIYFIKQHSHLALNFITPNSSLYGGALMSFLVIAFLPKNTHLLFRKPILKTLILTFLLGLFFFFLSLSTGPILWLVTIVLGICYGILFMILSTSLIELLRGPNFLFNTAQVQAYSQVASVIALSSIGFLIDLRISPEALFQVIACICTCSVLILGVTAYRKNFIFICLHKTSSS